MLPSCDLISSVFTACLVQVLTFFASSRGLQAVAPNTDALPLDLEADAQKGAHFLMIEMAQP